MNEQEIREVLKQRGYILDKIVHFKHSDRIRWHSKTLNVSLNLGKRIEDVDLKDFMLFVMVYAK